MFEAFISFVISAILIFYILGFVGRIALKLFIKRKQREFSQNFDTRGRHAGQNQYGRGNSDSASNGYTKRDEGKVHVQQTTNTKKRVSRNVGKYIDFEEVK